MVRIPKTDPGVRLNIANQPNIPISYGTDAGKAMQQLGRGIGQLGRGLEGAIGHDNENADLEERLQQLKVENSLDADYRSATSGYNVDNDDPNEWQRGVHGSVERRLGEYDTKVAPPRNERQGLKREIWKQRLRNRYQSQARGQANGYVRQRAVNGVEAAVAGEYNKMSQAFDQNSPYYIHPSDPDYAAKFANRLQSVQQGTNLMINKLNAPENVKTALRNKSAAAALGTLKQLSETAGGVGAIRAYEVAKGMLLGTGAGEQGQLEENKPPPGVGQQEASVSGQAKVSNDNKPVTSTAFKIHNSDKVLTGSQRSAIFRKGGVVVNLDTNWGKSNGGRTSPMVVIPDKATAAQRQGAEAYVAELKKVYKEQFGVDINPRVVTRSKNGRGRTATIHTEPFAVTDKQAVQYFSSPQGMQRLAQITQGTLGKIPGVEFSVPHNPAKGDFGAHGNGTNEVKLARALIGAMQGGGEQVPSAVPTEPYKVASASGNVAPPGQQANLSPEMSKGLRAVMPALERANQKAIELQRQMGRVKQYVTGELTFNRFDADAKKYVNHWAETTKVGERLLQGDQSTVGMIVMTSKTLNYVPKPWAETLRTMAMSKDPRQQGMAYETAASILTGNPNALEGDGLKRLRDEAQTYRAFTATGDSPQEAMARMAEMKTEEWAKRKEAFKAKLEGKGGLLANIDEDDVETALGDTVTLIEEDPSLNPARKELIIVEYKELFSYHYLRTGKEDAAHKLAGQEMQRVYGRSSATGQSMFMRYPPEKSYPPIGNTGHQYLQDDLKRSVTNYLHMKRVQEQGINTPPGIGPDASEPPEVDMDNVTIQFIENKTSERIAGGKLPYYRVIYNDPDTGIPVVLPGAWGLNDEHIKAYQDAYVGEFDKRRAEFLNKTDAERSNDSSPSMWLRRQLPQFMQDWADGMDERPEPVIIPRKK